MHKCILNQIYIYKELYNSEEGGLINYFNTQTYFKYSLQTLQNIVNNGYDPHKIVLGTLSSQFMNDFELFINILIRCVQHYPNWGGVYNWEYYTSPPDINDPSKWAQEIYKILK